MKRRNADCGKIRRPIKRNKITEGMYGSTTVLYLKFLILWAIVITADFMFMFRFEFLWPFWLLLRSVHDSFKYKGLAFSVLFVCIAITSDLVCLFFIPVHWLLFAASTYVWVQYVWHTDKGICLPTIILWMLFVYLEAGIRWKDSRHMPHLDLCRPFAAHCIGYPVVTLGFGFKSYVGYRMRQRKQREVAKENEFYMQLLQQALPQEENPDEVTATANGSVLNSAALATATVPVSQTNSIAATADQHSHSSHVHHNQHHQSQQNSSVNSSSSSSNDDRANVQITGQLGSNHQQQSVGTTGTTLMASQTATSGTQHQHQSNINLNCNSTNNSNSNNSSASRNAQTTNSKANNVNGSTNASFLSTSFSSSLGSSTSNGHIPNGGASNLTTSHKNQRKSVDKDKFDSNYINSNNVNTTINSNNNNNNNKIQSNMTGNNLSGNIIENYMNNSTKFTSSSYNSNQISNKDANHNNKEKDIWENGNNSHSSSNNFGKENHKTGGNSHNYEHTNGVSSGNDKKSHANGNVLQYETEDIPEPVEKKEKGRRNRSKKDTNSSSKDNHQSSSSSSSSHQLNNNNSNNNNNHHHHHHQQQHNNHHHKEKDNNSETSSISSSSSTTNISNIASQVVTKICEACLRLEAEVKKYRSEVSHMKQIENELRQKLESNITTKSCLQAKQRECDELEKRLQDVTNQRQVDLINLQNTERKLCEERRQRQSLEAQLNNEKKARKIAEEKASRQECSEACKDRKRKQEQELQQLRHQLKMTEDAKQATEQQARKYEQELRMLEAEVRNREAQNGTEVLMNALAAMQDKNNTLEKNLSAETRVKLDLFSALGEAKRQLEIKDSKLRSKEDEVLDLKAKIAQLFAVMPNDSLCLPPCSTGSSMLRMNDTPPLQGPSSPLMGIGTAAAVAAVAASHQQMMAVAAVAHQLNSRGSSVAPPTVVSSCSTVTNVAGVPANVGNAGVVNNSICSAGGVVPVITNPSTSIGNNNAPGNNGGVSVSQTSSNLDPNATAYTPKNSLVGGAEA